MSSRAGRQATTAQHTMGALPVPSGRQGGTAQDAHRHGAPSGTSHSRREALPGSWPSPIWIWPLGPPTRFRCHGRSNCGPGRLDREPPTVKFLLQTVACKPYSVWSDATSVRSNAMNPIDSREGPESTKPHRTGPTLCIGPKPRSDALDSRALAVPP